MREWGIAAGLFLVSLAIFTYQAGTVGLEFKGDEGFYYVSSRQMLASGDWITPYYFDRPRFEKPILYYWIVAGSFKLFGIDWAAARLPSAVSMALVVALTYLLSIMYFNRRVGLFASVIMMSTIATFRYARLVLPEAFFLFLVSAALFFMLRRRYYTAYIFTGLAVLTKGPVGLILPLFVTAVYRYGKGDKGFLREGRIPQGFVISAALSLPWFLAMIKIHGMEYIDHVFFRETIQRIGVFDAKALFYFLPVIFIFCLPWSLFIFHALREAAWRIPRGNAPGDGAIMCLAWFLAVFVFFTFLGEKHRHYMLYAAVPLSIMTGAYLGGLIPRRGPVRTAVIVAPFILAFFIFEASVFYISGRIGGIGAIFEKRDYNIEKGDLVAIGSHSMIPQELEIHANHPVEKYGYKLMTEEKTEKRNRSWLNSRIFRKSENFYLLIEKDDFDRYMTEETKKRLTILDEGYMYSKGATPGALRDALKRREMEAFLDLFRKKVYFVTDKEDAI
jgi:4-amino-4-deoxy-L-arabinose transferase-like glycosyltransferase